MMDQQKKNHRIILLIFAMSIIPFLIAFILIRTGTFSIKPNLGLVIPPIPTCDEIILSSKKTCRSEFLGIDQFSKEHMSELAGHWLLVNIIPTGKCNELCLKAILETRQIRLMLNRDLPRTRRVVLLLNDPTEDANQWWIKDSLLWVLNSEKGKNTEEIKKDSRRYAWYLHEDNKVDELIKESMEKTNTGKTVEQVKNEILQTSELIRVKPNPGLAKKINESRKGKIPDGMLYLIDPMGNIMMQYEPGFNPYKVKDDLMLLLRASQIG